MKKFRLWVVCFLLLFTFSSSVFAASQQASATNASVIITNARTYLNEGTAVFWSDAELLVWVNEGTMDIVARTHCLDGSETEALIVDTLSYALSDPYLLIYAVIYDKGSGDETGLIRGNLQSIGHVKPGGGVPIYWCQSGDNVIVYPKPNAANSGAGKDIDVYTITRPTAVAADAAVLVPACFDKALTLYLVAQAFAKDGQFNKAGMMMQLYQGELDRYRTDFITVPKEPVEIIK